MRPAASPVIGDDKHTMPARGRAQVIFRKLGAKRPFKLLRAPFLPTVLRLDSDFDQGAGGRKSYAEARPGSRSACEGIAFSADVAPQNIGGTRRARSFHLGRKPYVASAVQAMLGQSTRHPTRFRTIQVYPKDLAGASGAS